MDDKRTKPNSDTIQFVLPSNNGGNQSSMISRNTDPESESVKRKADETTPTSAPKKPRRLIITSEVRKINHSTGASSSVDDLVDKGLEHAETAVNPKAIKANRQLKRVLASMFFYKPGRVHKISGEELGSIGCRLCHPEKNYENHNNEIIVALEDRFKLSRYNKPAHSFLEVITHMVQHHCKNSDPTKNYQHSVSMFTFCPISIDCDINVGTQDAAIKAHRVEYHPETTKVRQFLKCVETCGTRFNAFKNFHRHATRCQKMKDYLEESAKFLAQIPREESGRLIGGDWEEGLNFFIEEL